MGSPERRSIIGKTRPWDPDIDAASVDFTGGKPLSPKLRWQLVLREAARVSKRVAREAVPKVHANAIDKSFPPR